jgi:hypothetical protein
VDANYRGKNSTMDIHEYDKPNANLAILMRDSPSARKKGKRNAYEIKGKLNGFAGAFEEFINDVGTSLLGGTHKTDSGIFMISEDLKSAHGLRQY